MENSKDNMDTDLRKTLRLKIEGSFLLRTVPLIGSTFFLYHVYKDIAICTLVFSLALYLFISV